MTAKYQITVQAETMLELTEGVRQMAERLKLLAPTTAEAALGLFPDAVLTIEPEPSRNAPLPMPMASPDTSYGPGLPEPPPDYVAAGLTEFQQLQVRQAQSQPVPFAMAEAHPLTQAQAPSAPVAYAPPQTIAGAQAEAASVPFCPIHQKQMIWKGGAISKSGKQMPLWSCPERPCDQAIWAPR